MSILGTRVRRIEDPRFLEGLATFVDDLRDPRLDGAVHLVFVRSMSAHGRLVDVDVSGARDLPGVRAVFTAADLDLAPARPGGMGAPAAMARPWLAADRVRFVGEPVAVVAADSVAQAVDAAEAVIVEVDPLPAVIGVEAASADGTLLFPEVGTNVNSPQDDGWDETAGDDFWAGCEVVVRARLVNQRVAGVSLEGRGSAAVWEGDRLVQWISTQSPHGVRSNLARAHGLAPEAIRVIAPDVGGGFGPKINPSPEDVIVGWVARRLDRPARWIETRSENLQSQVQGRDQVHRVAIGGTRDGRVLAYELDIVADCGAYPLLGAFLPYFTRQMASGVYDLARVRSRARAVVTNTVPTEAFRGAGRPEATAAIERAMDLFAAEIGMDPVTCRRRNLIPPGAFPFRTASGATYDVGAYEACLDRALAAADHAGLRDEQARRRAAGDPVLLGVGVSLYVEVTGAGLAREFGAVRVSPDGGAGVGEDGVRVTVLTGTSPHGQGIATALAMIASDALGVPVERITVLHGDTDLVPTGNGTMASRSLQMGGSAVRAAADRVLAAARELAAAELEADPADVVLAAEGGAFHVVGTPGRAVPWARVAAAAEEATLHAAEGAMADEASANPLWVEGQFDTDGSTFPSGAHVAVVEVDAETGLVTLRRLVACDDAGRIVNPLLAEGQRQGGIAQGVAQALFEAVRYDADGNPLTATLADYGIPSAADLPGWDLVAMETPTPLNVLGAKGIGESGTIGATPAVQSAVVDAVSHLGIRHLDLPLTPERVWRAIRDATG